MIKYKHALALNPYFGDSTAFIGVFPPTGLEYIATSLKDLVGKVTLLDLRYEKAYQDPKVLSKFISLCTGWPDEKCERRDRARLSADIRYSNNIMRAFSQ